MTKKMSTTSNHKEIIRFSLRAQKECLESLLARDATVTRDTVESHLNDINKQLEKLTMGRRGSSNRALSPYNHFVKAKLPEVAKRYPDIDNRARMSRVSEMWKSLSPTEKAGFAN